MPSFMVMVQNESGDWEGLGERRFEVAPQRGNLITNDGENGETLTYSVLGIVQPMNGSSTAGDLVVRLVGRCYEDYRAAVKALH